MRPRELLEGSVARAQNNEGRRIMSSKADCLGIRLPVCSVPAEAYDLIINDCARNTGRRSVVVDFYRLLEVVFGFQ